MIDEILKTKRHRLKFEESVLCYVPIEETDLRLNLLCCDPFEIYCLLYLLDGFILACDLLDLVFFFLMEFLEMQFELSEECEWRRNMIVIRIFTIY